MTLSDSVNNTVDLARLKEFAKLPENKLWLGQVAMLYKDLAAMPIVTAINQLNGTTDELLRLSTRGIQLAEAAAQGGDTDDVLMVAKFCDALRDRYRRTLSPELQVLAKRGIPK